MALDVETQRGLGLVCFPEIGTVRDVAAHLRITIPTVRRLIRDGVIPARKIGARWYVARRELLGLFERRGSPAAALLRDLIGLVPETEEQGPPTLRLVEKERP